MPIDPADLRAHLQLALDGYGGDLPLAVPELPARTAAAPAAPAAPWTSAAAPKPAPAAGSGPAAPPPPKPPLPRPVAALGGGTAAVPPPACPAAATLAGLRAELVDCTRCKLHQGRNQVVFGEGDPAARVLFVGEAPGANEDRTGRPFVGAAGELLDRIIHNAMGMKRSEVYIANVNKCRPPDNRAPEADEVAACLPFLRQQVEAIRPQVIVCLGRVAAQNLLGTTASTTSLRGRDLDYLGIPVVVTWHPAYLLRDPSHKGETWTDIKRVNRLLGRPEVPPPATS